MMYIDVTELDESQEGKPSEEPDSKPEEIKEKESMGPEKNGSNESSIEKEVEQPCQLSQDDVPAQPEKSLEDEPVKEPLMDPAPAEKNDQPPAITDEEEGEIKDTPKKAEGTKRKVSDVKEIDPDTVSDAVEKFIVAEAEVGPPAAKKSKPEDQTPSKKTKKLTEDEKAANDLMAKVMRDAKREVDKTLGGAAAAANLGTKSSKPDSENAADQKAERRSLASWTLWPTDMHLQKFVEATGFDTKDKSHDQIHDELCAFPAFKKAWISFAQLHESGNCTKKDRAQIRQKSMEYGPKIQAKKKDGRMQCAKVLWPTSQHFETFQKETGWEERAKAGHFDTEEKQVVRLLNIAAFKEQWDHFAKLQEQSKVTKADRVHIRKAATLIGASKEVRKKREAQAAAKMQRQMQQEQVNNRQNSDLRDKIGGRHGPLPQRGPWLQQPGTMFEQPNSMMGGGGGPNPMMMDGPNPMMMEGPNPMMMMMEGSVNPMMMGGRPGQMMMDGTNPFNGSGPGHTMMGSGLNQMGGPNYGRPPQQMGEDEPSFSPENRYNHRGGSRGDRPSPGTASRPTSAAQPKKGYERLNLDKAAMMPPQEMLRYVQKCAHSYAAELDSRFPDCRKVMSRLVKTSIPDPRVDKEKPYVPCDLYNQDNSCMMGMIHIDAHLNGRIHSCSLCYFAMAGMINHHRQTQCPLLSLLEP